MIGKTNAQITLNGKDHLVELVKFNFVNSNMKISSSSIFKEKTFLDTDDDYFPYSTTLSELYEEYDKIEIEGKGMSNKKSKTAA